MYYGDPISAAAFAARVRWDAFGWFAEHQLCGESYWNDGRGARWEIGKPDTFVFRCEIVAGLGGSLLVHGDIDLSRFAAYGDKPDAWSRLLWMADCTDVGYYVAQKAKIGNHHERLHYEEAVAVHDINEHLRELENAVPPPDSRLVEALKDALAYGATDSESALTRFLSEQDRGWELWDRGYGRVLAPHVIVAHVALNKCAWLLREKHGDEGPPACRRPK